MSILSLMAKLSLDGRNFKAGIREAQVSVTRFAEHELKHIKQAIVGAFGVVAIEQFAHSVVATATRIKDLSEQFGVTTEEVQQLDYAASKVGLQFEDWGAALIKIGKAREAAAGDQKIRDLFATFGQSWSKVNNAGITNNEILVSILQHSKGISANARERAELDELAGKKAEKLLALQEQIAAAKKDAPIISDADIEAIDKMEKGLHRVWLQVKALAATKLGNILAEPAKAVERSDRYRYNLEHGTTLDAEAYRKMLAGETSAAKNEPSDAEKYGFNIKAMQGEQMRADELAQKRGVELLEAQAKLNQSIYELELKRHFGANRRLQLEREIRDLEAGRRNTIGPLTEAENMERQAEINKKKAELMGMERFKLGADSLQKLGILTGGTLSRAALYGTAAASVGNIDIPRAQLDVQKKSLNALNKIASQRPPTLTAAH